MRSLQISELSFHSQQEEDQRKDFSQKILQAMPQTHSAQGSEVVLIGGKRGCWLVVNHGSPKAEPGVRFPPSLHYEKIFSLFSSAFVHCRLGGAGFWFL